MGMILKKTNKSIFIKVSAIVLLIFLFSSCTSSQITSSPAIANSLDDRVGYLNAQVNNGSIISFKIPPCDPLSTSNLKTRSFSYDVALAAIAFEMLGSHKKSADLLSKIEGFISSESGIDFSFDAINGALGIRYVRSGAAAWLGYALVYSDRLTHAQILAEFMMTRRVSIPGDVREGLFRGGFGEIKKDRFIEKEIEWISTEHNIDTYFFFRDLGVKLKKYDLQSAAKYSQVAQELKRLIIQKFWNPNEEHFYRGMSLAGIDKETPLDVQTWGSLFLIAIGEEDKARSALKFAKKNFFVNQIVVQKELKDKNRLNCQYECLSSPFMGFKPYLDSPEYRSPPDLIWTEGTYGYSLAAKRLSMNDPELESSQQKLESCNLYGGVLQVTETRNAIPYEFHTWESTASTVWSLFNSIEPKLPERLRLWASDQSLGLNHGN